MLDDKELEQTDPKRFGLENDRILLESVKQQLKNKYDLYPTNIQQDMRRLESETDPLLKLLIQYQIEQKRNLLKMINVYNDDINKLVKEDVL